LDRKLQHVAIMDQAGSGKTLAYLLPMIQLLKAEERERAAAAITEDKAESDAARERPSAGPPLSAGSPGPKINCCSSHDRCEHSFAKEAMPLLSVR
jgi:Ni2+-binding GTPase involved in maturation of urease and hydrogenase